MTTHIKYPINYEEPLDILFGIGCMYFADTMRTYGKTAAFTTMMLCCATTMVGISYVTAEKNIPDVLSMSGVVETTAHESIL